jgi:hypothetical protein
MNVTSGDIAQVTDGLVKAVAKKAGLTEDQSRKAVLAAFDYLKGHLPPATAADIDKFVQGGGDLNQAVEWFLTQIGRK